ncbi:rhomboid family intramembrane serine protease [Sphingomonas oleivorans]|uniref:Rhomboid family intramembrane serine protease n=1 Tax=Sphingomonas oleivorans TaxID=1735121 RepID=A0A2T5FWQ7_9SPHN|nr:rhomboid family intramembrane serine protease [Sphingomonas oleivorans]PTQ10198.1 rhomboid family intramembrane serine protease [Sphingomonas oleivorans]
MRSPSPRASIALVAASTVVWLLISTTGYRELAALAGGFIPGRVSGAVQVIGAVPIWLTPLTATLLHAGALHLLFNMAVLGFAGRATEGVLGARGVIALYGTGAYAAAAAQFLVDPGSAVPMVGASGAISAVVGAYSLLYGRRPAVAHAGLARLLHIAWLAAGWIGVQLLVGFATAQSGAAIAVAAHIGGFLAGLLMARPLLLWRYRRA